MIKIASQKKKTRDGGKGWKYINIATYHIYFLQQMSTTIYHEKQNPGLFLRLIKRFNKNQDKLKRVRDELISGMHEGISISSSRHGKNFVNLGCWF